MGHCGVLHLYDAARGLSPMRREGRSGSVGRRQADADSDIHAVSGRLGQAHVLERSCGGLPHVMGEGLSIGGVDCGMGSGSPRPVRGERDRGRRAALAQGTTATLNGFFNTFGEDRAQQLKFICSDMWRPYLDVMAKKASQALHVLDRFHIVAYMNKAIDHVRAQEARDLKAKGYEPVLKQSRWCLLKRPENRTEAQNIKLKELLQYNLKIVRSFLLKEDFQFFWEYTSPHWAGLFLDHWCRRTMRSQIEPMKKVARTLRAHRELLLNWFRARKQISAGMVEGFNNRAAQTVISKSPLRQIIRHVLAQRSWYRKETKRCATLFELYRPSFS